MSTSPTQPKATAGPTAKSFFGIDLTFRPRSYFWPLGLEKHLLSRVKGAERKAALRNLIDAGRIDEIPEFLSSSALSDEGRAALGRIHPAFMGGEYLPNLLHHEVMIARITIASTTRDTTCVYARRQKHRIQYRVVDEYSGDTLSRRTTRSSTKPLSLGQLEAFFNGAWSIFEVLEMNFGEDGYDVDEMQSFIVSVDSDFYPEFGGLYRCRIDEWAAERRPSGDEDEPEDARIE